MIIECFAKDCIYNIRNKCNKDKIEIKKVNAYDDNCAECMEYIKKDN